MKGAGAKASALFFFAPRFGSETINFEHSLIIAASILMMLGTG